MYNYDYRTPQNYLSAAKSSLTRIVNGAIDTGINYGMNYCKNTLGKEYVFSQEDDKEVIGAITNDFIAKVYKNIESVGFKNKFDRFELKNVEFIIPLGTKRKDTFIYVATGNKMGSFEERFMSSRNISEMDMKLFVFGKRTHIVVDKLQKIIDKASMISNELGIYDINSGMDSDEKGNRRGSGLHIVYNQMQPRTMETMYFSSGEKEIINEHIQRFKENYQFYHDRQLLYKTGLLLYGEPGTGKSSLVKAIATRYNRSILNVSVSDFEFIDINKLTQSINTDTTQEYIVLLEDIDTLFLNREYEDTDKEARKVINKLLQFLDSNSSPNNVIFIATTNYVERLDKALLRAGRFDIKVEVKALDYAGTVKFGESFGLSRAIIDNICRKHVNEGEDIKKHLYNQSTLQIEFISNLSKKSLEDVTDMYAETLGLEVKKVDANEDDDDDEF